MLTRPETPAKLGDSNCDEAGDQTGGLIESCTHLNFSIAHFMDVRPSKMIAQIVDLPLDADFGDKARCTLCRNLTVFRSNFYSCHRNVGLAYLFLENCSKQFRVIRFNHIERIEVN